MVRRPARGWSQLYSGQLERFYRQYRRREGQGKHFVICASSPHPIPSHTFTTFRREKFSPDFQKDFDALSITCFHLNSPATDTIPIACGKTGRVPRLRSTETPHGPTRPHRTMPGAGRRHHPACTPSTAFSIRQKRWQLGSAAENRLKQ